MATDIAAQLNLGACPFTTTRCLHGYYHSHHPSLSWLDACGHRCCWSCALRRWGVSPPPGNMAIHRGAGLPAPGEGGTPCTAGVTPVACRLFSLQALLPAGCTTLRLAVTLRATHASCSGAERAPSAAQHNQTNQQWERVKHTTSRILV